MSVADVCGHEIAPGRWQSRGLCHKCYMKASRNGRLNQYPKMGPKKTVHDWGTGPRWKPQDVADEVESAGITFWSSDRLSLRPMGLFRALEKAQRNDLIERLGGEKEARNAADANARQRTAGSR